jgi:hypothetical protein
MGAENDAEVRAKLSDLLRLARGGHYPKLGRRLDALKRRKSRTASELAQRLDDMAARCGLEWVVEEAVPDLDAWLLGRAAENTPRRIERYYKQDSWVDGPWNLEKWGDDYDEWAADNERINREFEEPGVSTVVDPERKRRRNPLCRICNKNPMVSRIHGRYGACQKYCERHDGRERTEFLTKTTKDAAAEAAEFVAERAHVARLPKARQDAAEPRNRREVPVNPGHLDDPTAETS